MGGRLSQCLFAEAAAVMFTGAEERVPLFGRFGHAEGCELQRFSSYLNPGVSKVARSGNLVQPLEAEKHEGVCHELNTRECLDFNAIMSGAFYTYRRSLR